MDCRYYLAHCRLEGQSGHEAGLALLEQLYRTHGGASLPPILRQPGGKPYFPDAAWHFSISHTRHHAFCVLARQPVGIDAEEADRPVNLEIAKKILSDREFAQFSAAEDPRQALLRFWVLKEADAKRTGEGIRFHPRHTGFSLDDPRLQTLDGCIIAVIL